MTAKPANIFAAFVGAQREMVRAMKDTPNPHFRSKYADLAAVQDACMPALHKHGFGIVQPLERTEHGYQIRTLLIHESGEKMEPDCPIPLILGKSDMQGLGSAITYARRYGLFCLTGVAPEDDDGNEAAKQAPSKLTPRTDWTVDEEPGLQTGVKGAHVAHDASPGEKAKAYADRICEQFGEAKRVDGVEGVWRRNEAVIERLKASYEALYQNVLDAYRARLEAIKEEKAA